MDWDNLFGKTPESRRALLIAFCAALFTLGFNFGVQWSKEEKLPNIPVGVLSQVDDDPRRLRWSYHWQPQHNLKDPAYFLAGSTPTPVPTPTPFRQKTEYIMNYNFPGNGKVESIQVTCPVCRNKPKNLRRHRTTCVTDLRSR